MNIIEDRLEFLSTLTLDSGAHKDFSEGHCAMEVVAWLAGEGHTDAPECASPVLRAFTIGLNDQWDKIRRQELVPFLPRMVGTAGDGKDEARSYLALDWLIRTYTPAFLELANLSEEARALRDLRRIVDAATAKEAGPVVRVGRDRASAAGDAAWAAAGDAAGVAAGDAAGDAAGVAAWAAAGDAAGVAAGDAAWDAAGVAAWVAAWDAAGDAAGVAAWAAAWVAAGTAAGAAARAFLAPTVATLQASALELLNTMIDPA